MVQPFYNRNLQELIGNIHWRRTQIHIRQSDLPWHAKPKHRSPISPKLRYIPSPGEKPLLSDSGLGHLYQHIEEKPLGYIFYQLGNLLNF